MADGVLRLCRFLFVVLSRSFSYYTLLKCTFTSLKLGQPKELTAVLRDTAAILTFYFLAFHLTLRLYLWESVAMTTLSGWWGGSIHSVWQSVWLCASAHGGRQAGSQTAVPAESSYHHQGRLKRDEQINYGLCVVPIKCTKNSDREMKAVKPFYCTKMDNISFFLTSYQNVSKSRSKVCIRWE